MISILAYLHYETNEYSLIHSRLYYIYIYDFRERKSKNLNLIV